MDTPAPSRRARDARPLRRTRGDLLAAGALAAAAAVLVGGAWATAPIHTVEHTTASGAADTGELTAVPAAVSEAFRVPDTELPGVHRPVTTHGLVVGTDGQTLTAYDNTGAAVYSYGRADREICSLGQAWDDVVVTYRSGIGCGDVTSLDGATGEYSATRSAINDAHPVALSSNDRVGTAGRDRVELWRSDLVRTVEYGAVAAPQEPDLQPHPDCTVTSALTRTDLLAVTEVCPEDPDTGMLRLQEVTPEESRKPEISASVALPSPDARLVGVGQDAAAVYVPGDEPVLQSFDTAGRELASTPVAASALLDSADGVYNVPTGDLPHHMTYFDGRRLYLLSPNDLAVAHVIDDVAGTGVAVDGRLLVPVADGIAVVDWDTGRKDRTIAVDREGWDGDVHLAVAGGVIAEKRGDQIVAYSPD